MLNKYLENGTKEVPRTTLKSAKLLSVGLRTKIVGGNLKISSNGLNALLTIIISGKILKIPAIAKNKNRAISPAFERLIRFFFLLLLNTLELDISAKGRESICFAS